MHKQGHIMSLKYPITHEFLKCMGFLFVDDTDLIVIGNEEESGVQVCQRQQNEVASWESALKFTGGALKATKCYWYFVDFRSIHVQVDLVIHPATLLDQQGSLL